MNKRKYLFIVIATVIILGTVVFLLMRMNEEKTRSYEFNGTIERVNGDAITVSGDFIYDQESIRDSQTSTVEILIDSDTKITRTELVLPTAEELKKTNGAFYPDKLEKKVTTANLLTLQTDFRDHAIGVFVKTADEISGDKKFTASEINYRLAKSAQ